jgi:histone H3/H4
MSNSTTIKVLELMRKHSGGYKISKDAWREMKDRLELFFEVHMQDITCIARRYGRHTVMESDVVEYFGFLGNDEFGRGDDEL